jgi:hypothetical protein
MTHTALILALVLQQQVPIGGEGEGGGPEAERVRCAMTSPEFLPNGQGLPVSDCSLFSTNPSAAYAPTFVYEVPVVFHVIQDSLGQGYLSPAQIQSQIDVLNEDFRALPGSPGAPGSDAMIHFELASVDPNGNPTSGITYSINTTWFNDGGQYWNALAWDPNRYLNVYTNDATGSFGYVPAVPQSGGVGLASDRVVLYWQVVGKNAPYGPPHHMGRTATHEIGHYLGLFHTFQGGCSTSGCNNAGDLICDTNAALAPTFGCPQSKFGCSGSEPVHNYMDYTDDACVWEFTSEQILRMRCTLEYWRPELWSVTAGCGLVTKYCTAGTSAQGCKAKLRTSGVPSASAPSGFELRVERGDVGKQGIFFYGTNGAQAKPWGNGTSFQCVLPPVSRTPLVTMTGSSGGCVGTAELDLNALWCPTCPKPHKNPGAGASVDAQFWYRDPANTSNQVTSLSDAGSFQLCP